MDRTLDVRTPESMSFSYELAGLGSRALALAVDQSIQILVLAALFTGLVLAAPHLPRPLASGAASKVVESTALAIVITVLFVVFFGYFIIFEAAWNGQTPGKKLIGLRVVRDGGYPMDLGASLIRNLIRVGEQIVGYYLIAAVSMVLSPENKRLGDIAAGTIVVREGRLSEPRSQGQRTVEPVYAATAYLDGDERALLKRFIERRDELSPERRAALAGKLADRVRGRVPEDLARLGDEALLERLG